MKQYKDLNLRDIRIKTDLDFAHFTYPKNMCSCCYGPKDLPARYWKNGVKKDRDYTYILFKNADNGSGTVTRNDTIGTYVCIAHKFKDNAQKEEFCKLLMLQLDEDYVIEIPYDDSYCIIIYQKSRLDDTLKSDKARYITVKDGEVVEYKEQEKIS